MLLIYKKYIIKGCYIIKDKNTIIINELPIGTWTQNYKEFLETLLDSKLKVKSDEELYIKDFKDMSTDTQVEFEVIFYPNSINKLLSKNNENGIDGIEKYLKLYTTHSTTNMHLFNSNEQLKKYETIYEIIDEFYNIRYKLYEKRKVYLIDKIENDLKLLSNKTKFIQYNIDDKIDLRKKSKEEINEIMNSFKFDMGEDNTFNYLTKLPMDSVCKENVEKLTKEYKEKENNINTIKCTSIEDTWLSELNILKNYL